MEIELIKDKVLSNNFKLSKDEQLVLSECYFEITKIATGKGKVLSLGCQGCLLTAYTVIQNFIKYHYTQQEEPKAKVELKKVDVSNRTRQEMKDILTKEGIKFHHNISDKKLNELISQL